MSTRYALKATKREGTGKGTARALRREGKVPAVIYGDNKEPVTISLDGNELTKEYMKGHLFTTICEIEVEGNKELVLARDAQLHPVKDNVLHVDYLRVTKRTKIPVFVPVTFINEDQNEALQDVGVLSVTRYEVEVYCSALQIPESLEVDLIGYEIGDTIKSTSIKLPEGVEFTIADREFTLASIIEPKAPLVEEEEEGEVELDEEGNPIEPKDGEEESEASEGEDSEGGEEKSEG